MKLQQTKVMFFLLALISTLIFRPSEAQPNSNLCSTTAIDNVPGCFYAVRLAASGDLRWLSRDCCKAVRKLPDTCYLLVVPGKAYYTNIFRSICINKFPGVLRSQLRFIIFSIFFFFLLCLIEYVITRESLSTICITLNLSIQERRRCTITIERDNDILFP